MEGLRAYAILAVLAVHSLGSYSNNILNTNRNSLRIWDLEELSDIAFQIIWRSHYGVDLFFLLSGFLIFRIVAKPGFTYLTFIKNRIIRIYPAFLFSLAIYIYFTAIYMHLIPLDIWLIAKNLVFMNGIPGLNIRGYNHASWSLFSEFSFFKMVVSKLVSAPYLINPTEVA